MSYETPSEELSERVMAAFLNAIADVDMSDYRRQYLEGAYRDMRQDPEVWARVCAAWKATQPQTSEWVPPATVDFPDRSIPLDDLHYDAELGLHQKSQCEELHGERDRAPRPLDPDGTPVASIHSAPYGDEIMRANDARWAAKGL